MSTRDALECISRALRLLRTDRSVTSCFRVVLSASARFRSGPEVVLKVLLIRCADILQQQNLYALSRVYLSHAYLHKSDIRLYMLICTKPNEVESGDQMENRIFKLERGGEADENLAPSKAGH